MLLPETSATAMVSKGFEPLRQAWETWLQDTILIEARAAGDPPQWPAHVQQGAHISLLAAGHSDRGGPHPGGLLTIRGAPIGMLD